MSEQKLEKIEQKLDSLIDITSRGFQNIEDRFQGLEKRVDVLEVKVEDLAGTVNDIQSTVDRIDSRQTSQQSETDDFRDRMRVVETKISTT